MIRDIINLYILVYGIIKDKKIPIFIRVLIGIYTTVVFLTMFIPLLMLTLTVISVLLLFGIIAVIVFFMLLFPLLCICSSIIDVFWGKRLRDYKENKLLKYHLPGFTYCFSGILLTGIGAYLESRISLFAYQDNIYLIMCNTIILYMGISVVYVFIFYLGMWRRIGHIDGGEFFLITLDKHRKFLKLSFIPLSFVITVMGFLSVFGDVNISLIFVIKFIFKVLDGVKQNSLQYGIILMIIVYIFSIPVQLLALFINNQFVYIFEEGNYYKQMIIRIIKPIYKELKPILWSQDCKYINLFNKEKHDENNINRNS